jgi:hypothetical protein
MTTSDKRARAVQLASDFGFHVFPLNSNGKTPFWKEWEGKASNDPATVHRYWTEPVTGGALDYNIAVATGPSKLCVIDYDVKHGQDPWGHHGSLIGTLELFGGEPFEVRTPSGGAHLYFKADDEFRNSAGKLGKGIDVRGAGGYVVAPGSEIDGKTYTLASNGRPPDIAGVPNLAEALKSARRREVDSGPAPAVELDRPAAIERARDYLVHRAPEAVEGASGDATTYTVCAAVKDFGVSEQTAFELISEHWNEAEKAIPPWSPEDLLAKVQNAYRYGTSPVGAKDAQFEFEPVELLSAPEAPRPKTGRLAAVTISELMAQSLRPAPQLVEGLLGRGALSSLYAKPGAGKSFAGLAQAACVATGKPFNGLATQQGFVIYIATEGGAGIAQRVNALVRTGALDTSSPFVVLRGALDLFNSDADLKALLSSIKDLESHFGSAALIVIDTFARVFFGGDENSAKDMGVVLGRIDGLRDATGAHVMLVHHPGKDGTKGARGSSALIGALDTELQIVPGSKPGEASKLVVTKQKDLEFISPMPFTLKQVGCGVTANLDPVTSCVVEWLPRSRLHDEKPAALSPELQTQLDALKRLAIDDPAAAISIDDWRGACGGSVGKETFRTRARALEARDLVTRPAKGKYSIAVFSDETGD